MQFPSRFVYEAEKKKRLFPSVHNRQKKLLSAAKKKEGFPGI
jgi:hypothetical protein